MFISYLAHLIKKGYMSFCHHLVSFCRSSVNFSHINLLLKINEFFYFAWMMYKCSFTTFPLIYQLKYTLEITERPIKNGQSRETGNTGHTRRRRQNKHTTQYLPDTETSVRIGINLCSYDVWKVLYKVHHVHHDTHGHHRYM